jgi:2-isopropylmalate synthase
MSSVVHHNLAAQNPSASHPLSIEVMDTTFKEETYGVSFAAGEKLSIISQLDSMGVAFIELHLEDREVLNSFKWTKGKPVVFLSDSSQYEIPPAVENVSIRASCLPYDLTSKRGDSPAAKESASGSVAEENLVSLKKRISALRKELKNVFFNAQHFFDGFYENSDYALTLLETAAKAGASRVVLCDTRGAAFPEQVQTAVKFASRYLSGLEVILGIHAHNDCGLAVSNTLSAVSAGARHVQATVNGIGERAGNADLCQLLPLLSLKMGHNVLNSSRPKQKQLLGLKSLSESMDRACGFSIQNQPFVSSRAFSHSDPSHCEVVSSNPRLYEPIDPSLVGNTRHVGVGDVSTILSQISELGLYSRNSKELAKKVLEKAKELESQGYKFTDALGSLHLLILEVMGSKINPFSISGWETSTVRASSNGIAKVRATVRAAMGQGSTSRNLAASSDGVGPVHAIDLAIKKALSEEFPELKHVKLVSYSLNIVDSLSGTAASARARTEFLDEDPPLGALSSAHPPTWATVSVSDDIIDASIRALVEGYKYKLIFLNKRERFALPDWRLALA